MGDQPGCPCSICGEDSGNPDVPLPTEHGNNQNLRTRIAAVIDREVDGLWEPLDVADAVIRELKLDKAAQDCRCHLRHLWETGK